MFFRYFISALLLLNPSLSLAGISPHTDYVLCKQKQIVRTIRVVQNDDGCTTEYTKAGVDRIVGAGEFLKSCRAVLKNIRGNLEGAAWRCRDISHARVDSNRQE